MRTETKYYHDHKRADGSTLVLELPYQADSIMEYKDYLVYEKNGKVLLGFLAHDHDAENPLENDDYAGKIYTAHRHSSSQQEMRKALGLDSGWEPDLELVSEDKILSAVLEVLRTNPSVMEDVFENYISNYTINEDESRLAYVTRIVADNDYEDIATEVGLDNIKEKLWKEGRTDGSIGNKYAVLLDVFEHGQVRYSVSGGGPQCQWDTARGGAVWVPSELGLENIKSMEDALKHAASDVQQYTDWCNGNCFCTVFVEYDENGVEVDNDSCGGYVGDDEAYRVLQEEFDSRKQSL